MLLEDPSIVGEPAVDLRRSVEGEVAVGPVGSRLLRYQCEDNSLRREPARSGPRKPNQGNRSFPGPSGVVKGLGACEKTLPDLMAAVRIDESVDESTKGYYWRANIRIRYGRPPR